MEKKMAWGGIRAYVLTFLKWGLIASLVGILGGIVGSAFHLCIDFVTELRIETPWLLYLLPLGGLLIAALYYVCKKWGKLDTNRVLCAVGEDESVPFIMAPLIFVSTAITHLLGGSAGREGAALQLGGSIGFTVGKVFRLGRRDLHIIVMSGMSAVFSALFGTPLAAAIFAIEVVSVGALYYTALVPCLLSSLAAYYVAIEAGVSPVRFLGTPIPDFSPEALLQTVALAILCALVSILFCTAIRRGDKLAEKLLPNSFWRGLLGGALLIFITILVGSRDYNGAGMDVIARAFLGEARPEAFLYKILFTAITIAVGFKGGEIVPAFFVGATFGCTVAPMLGLDPAFGAAVGFVALFCGAVNCPLASMLLALEVLGSEGILFYALACAVSYMMSGNFGLYKKQRIVYGKTEARYIDCYTK